MNEADLGLLAIETGFCKRSSKLTAAVFFDLLFYASSLSQNSSLEYLVSRLADVHGIEISKQGLDERFTMRAVDFVKAVLSRLIGAQFSDMLISESFFSCFNHVRIKDSTSFKVPDNLAESYSGNGGGIAGISIQYEYDLKTGKFLDLAITEAGRNDRKDAGETSENICEADLVIRDMGYFSTSVLRDFDGNKAFFLSRLPANVSVYDENGQETDLVKLGNKMARYGIEKMEKQVFIGESRFAVRLMIGSVPSDLYQERVRNKERSAKKKGRKMNEKTRSLLRLNLFVTNTDAQQLPIEKIMPLYRFRWQIELQFKIWKSLFSIHAMQKMKEARYITMLYIRLILIVVNMQISNRIQNLLSNRGGGILSYTKTMRTLKDRVSEVLSILRGSLEKAVCLLEKIYRTLSQNHWRDKRKKRENFTENICLFICIPE